MTCHYRIYTFQNGLGETVFRAKPVHKFLPQWATRWVEFADFSGIVVIHWTKWGQREGVLSAIERDARSRDRAARSAKEKVLKLVITEDVPVEVQ